jgi:hypothetical protein
MRFGIATHAGRRCYAATIAMQDADAGQPRRCEILLPPGATGLPSDGPFWWSSAFATPDLSGTKDTQCVWQWHAGDASGRQPILQLLQQGAVGILFVRSLAAPRGYRLWQGPMQPGAWQTWVARADLRTISPEPLQVWRNGQQLCNLAEPIGWGIPGGYAKQGMYFWDDDTNRWDVSRPVRTLHMTAPTVLREPSAATLAFLAEQPVP